MRISLSYDFVVIRARFQGIIVEFLLLYDLLNFSLGLLFVKLKSVCKQFSALVKVPKAIEVVRIDCDKFRGGEADDAVFAIDLVGGDKTSFF